MPTVAEHLSEDQVWVLLERVRDTDEWRAVATLLRALKAEKTQALLDRVEWMSEKEIAALAGEIRGIDRALAVVQGQERQEEPDG